MEDEASEHLGPDRVEPELEHCHNSEVATAATDPPQEILVFGGRGMQRPPVCRHHVGASQVVGGKAESACEMPESAPQRESRHPGGGNDPARYRQPECLGLVVDIAPYAAGIHVGAAAGPIDPNRPEPGQVDNQPVVARGVAGDVVAPAAYRGE